NDYDDRSIRIVGETGPLMTFLALASANRSACKFVFQVVLTQLASDRRTIDCQHSAEVRLHQDADRVATQPSGQFSRSSADSSLESKRNRPGAGTNRSLLNSAALRALDGIEDIFTRNMPPANVIEVAIVCFGNNGINR